MKAVECRSFTALSGHQSARRIHRRQLVVTAGVPWGYAPVPPPQLPTASVLQQQTPSSTNFTLLTAPSLTTAADLIDARATAPHWGSSVVEESLAAAAAVLQSQQAPPGTGQLTGALRDLQAALSENVQRLTALTDQAGGLGGAATGDVRDGLAAVAAQLQRVATGAREAASAATQLDLGLTSTSQAGGGATATLAAQLSSGQYAGYSLQTLALISAGVAALIALSVPRQGDDDLPGGGSGTGGSSGRGGSLAGSSLSSRDGGGDFLPTSWNAAAVEAYYKRRPALVARRVLEVSTEALSYGAALLADMVAGTSERNMGPRADQAMQSIERLGPAYVKVAQAMSTRVDLLQPAYLIAIQRLQDRVPPFPDAQAYASIERSFGRPLGQVFAQLSDTAVAAASLGQVYRGTLRDGGQEVAIKVRRPGVLDSVSLDLYLMRQVALQLRTMPSMRTDWVGIIDNWAGRFLDEMNYDLEADNTRQFKQDLSGLAGIVIPDVVEEGSTTDVLVTSWVQGERLTDSRAADVRQLCDTLLSAYLIQLLDTGLLHADPHPGNLLRTTDGRIAILDHGLIQDIPREYALTLLEYIAHLSVGDWDSLVDDLVALGFVDSVDNKQALVGPLGAILTQLTAGGGARKVNIAVVMDEIEKMTQLYEFKVPPYFALILRTFSVIEGIALQSDPDYSIIKECLPYLSRRLLTDDDPRARAALKELLFAKGDHISLDRIELLAKGLSNYTTDGLAGGGRLSAGVGMGADMPSLAAGALRPAAAAQQAQQGQQDQQPRPLIDSTAREVLGAVFSTRPTYVQELLVGEAVSTVDAAARQLAAALLSPALGNIAAAQTALQGGASGGSALGGTPGVPALSLLGRLPSLYELSPEDRQQLATARGITSLLMQQQQLAPAEARLTPALAQQLARELGPMLPQLLPGVAATGQLFLRALSQRAFGRVAAVFSGPKDQADPNYRAPMDL